MRIAAVLLILFGTSAARAETIVASVNGMVCSLCVTGIEKGFKKVPEVAGVVVDLETKKVTLQTRDGTTLDDARVTKVIVNAGYEVTGIARAR